MEPLGRYSQNLPTPAFRTAGRVQFSPLRTLLTRTGGQLSLSVCGPQIRPSFIFPASLIMDWFHTGSQTNSTSASATPGTPSTF